jgi:hypothetical protein
MKRTTAFHPILFAVFPVLFLYSNNINQMPLADMLKPLSIMFLIGAAAVLLAGRFQSKLLILIIASLILIFFFSFGHLSNRLSVQTGHTLSLGQVRLLLIGWLSVVFILGVSAFVFKRRAESITAFLNVVSIVLTAFQLLAIGGHFIHKMNSPPQSSAMAEPIVPHAQPDTVRDIYYIIFDRYPNSKTLKKIYRYDNSDFINYLRSKGFFVADKSNANYTKTALSLGATLNLRHITDMEKTYGRDSNDWLPLYAMLQDFRAWRFLKSQGYQFIHFGGWWDPTSKNRFADISYNIYPMREFLMLLYRTTILYPINAVKPKTQKFLDFNSHELQYERILYEFDKLSRIPRMKKPTFVFAHMLIPHDPYVFDRDGNYQTWEQTTSRTEEQNFVNQLVFLNKKIETLVDTLLTASPVKPIIIIQADEGPYPPKFKADQDNFKWQQATKSELLQKMGVLNALYFPGAPTSGLSESMTPVNTFRVLFNLYYDTQLPMLADKSYAFEDGRHPYTFNEVTNRLR